jgi:hypothetical protein
VGFLICSVGLKFINTAVLYSVLRPGWLLLPAGCCWLLLLAAMGDLRHTAVLWMLSLCCGPKKLWEICAVAYSPVYFRLKGR